MSDKKWFEKSYRRNLVDMHIEDWNEEFLSQFDPEFYVQQLKTAQVQSAMIYANSHVGYCYWPTKTGHMHKGLKGKDILGELIDLCHKENMDVIIYYSLIYNTWAYKNNPSWRLVEQDGKVSGDYKNRQKRYGKCCPNSIEYRDFTEKQIKEICQNYQFEGMFYDMTFWPVVCHCQFCKERYMKETGCEIPTVVDWNDSKWLMFQKKREEWLAEYASFATGIARKYKPGVTVEHNSATMSAIWRCGTSYELVKHNDYIGGDLYGGFHQQDFICKFYDSITLNKPFEYMTSRCYPNLKDHTTLKSKEMLALHTYISLAHGGAFLFIDAIDPVGTLNQKVYKRMGEIFIKSKQYEPYLGGRLMRDVALYFSTDSKMNMDENENGMMNGRGSYPHLDCALGAAKILRENHIPFGVIGKGNLRELSDIKVLVLPNIAMMSTEEAEQIKKFVEDGGSVYASGYRIAQLLGDLFGITYQGQTSETVTYITPQKKGEGVFKEADKQYPLCIFSPQAIVSTENNVDILATITLPYTTQEDSDKYASIHSDPPGIHTEYPSVVLSEYGKGKVVWVAAPIEENNQEHNKQAFVQFMKMLADGPFTFESDTHLAVEIILFHQPENKRYILNLVNLQEILPPVPVTDIKVKLNISDIKQIKATLQPDKQVLETRQYGNSVEIMVPKLEMFHMVVVDYE